MNREQTESTSPREVFGETGWMDKAKHDFLRIRNRFVPSQIENLHL